MKSKLDKLVADPNFGVGAKDHDTGIITYNDSDTLNYIILTYDGYYVIYLSLFDDMRDYLISSKSRSLDVAKQMAIDKLDRKINRSIH